jgi:hypothetical protein
MSEMIEQVARAIAKTIPGRAIEITPWTMIAASAAIEAADAYRAEEKRRSCKHERRIGTGCVGSDGSGWSTWYCQECGASYDSRATPTEASQS